MIKGNSQNGRAELINSELTELLIIQLFDKIFNRALSKKELITRKTIEDFFGTIDFNAQLNNVAALGIEGIIQTLTKPLCTESAEVLSRTESPSYSKMKSSASLFDGWR